MVNLFKNKIITGDCEKILRKIPDNSVDLIVTSPPYADSRSKIYDGPSPDNYVEWFIPKSKELLRILKPTGTFILNIKERVVDAERHTYVIELILALRRQGWLWTDEFIWHKKNSYPGKWPNRFRDAWERCLQFNKNKKFNIYQNSVMVPIGDWSKKRMKRLYKDDVIRRESKVNSGFGRNLKNWIGRNKVYPTNVLHIEQDLTNVLQIATESRNRNHSAVYPIALPSWFIKLFTKKGNIVLDPFIGSGTTAVAAKRLNRDYIGIDIKNEFTGLAKKRLKEEGNLN